MIIANVNCDEKGSGKGDGPLPDVFVSWQRRWLAKVKLEKDNVCDSKLLNVNVIWVFSEFWIALILYLETQDCASSVMLR